jgi:hypothetical protein
MISRMEEHSLITRVATTTIAAQLKHHWQQKNALLGVVSRVSGRRATKN